MGPLSAVGTYFLRRIMLLDSCILDKLLSFETVSGLRIRMISSIPLENIILENLRTPRDLAAFLEKTDNRITLFHADDYSSLISTP